MFSVSRVVVGKKGEISLQLNIKWPRKMLEFPLNYSEISCCTTFLLEAPVLFLTQLQRKLIWKEFQSSFGVR